MADKVNPMVRIVLDKERYLLYGFRAMRAYEERTGKNSLRMDVDNLSGFDLSVLLWACLLHNDKDITLEDAEYLVDEYCTINEISTYIIEAFNAAVSDKKSEEAKTNPVVPLSGVSSG